MKRYFGQFTVFLLLVLLVYVVRFPYSEYAERQLRTSVQDISRSQGISVDFDDLELGLPLSSTLKNLTASIPSELGSIPIVVDQLQIRPKLLPLALLRGEFLGELLLYRGEAKVELSAPFFDNKQELSANAKKISLGTHSNLAKLGISGFLDFKVDAKTKTADSSPPSIPIAKNLELISSTINIKLDDARYGGGYKVAGLVEIPVVSDISLDVGLEQLGKRIAIKDFAFYSSLGSLKGVGKLSISQEMLLKRLTLEGTIALTKNGADKFGGFLALQAGQGLNTKVRNWKFVAFKGSEDRIPQFKLEPL